MKTSQLSSPCCTSKLTLRLLLGAVALVIVAATASEPPPPSTKEPKV